MKSVQRFSPALLIASVMLGAAQAALAHAIVRSSIPAPGGQVSGDTVSIRLLFNSRIDHERSKLTLIASDGAQQALALTASPADGLNADVKSLASGSWRLRWQVLSVDGHITRGDIPFTVH